MNVKAKITNFILILIIILMLAPSVLLSLPKKTQAFWGIGDVGVSFDPLAETTSAAGAASGATSAATGLTQLGIKLKEVAQEVIRQVLMTAAKRVLAEMTKSTINWINSGFHGQPLFLENPDSFFNDIAKTQVKDIVDLIGYDTFRYPFGRQTALNVIDSYKSQLGINAQYSLSKVINDPDLLRKYRNDFNYGGWNGFLINTQYPQNNYLGFNMLVQQNLASRLEGTLQAPAQKVQSLLQQGMGFLSPQTCPSKPGLKINPYNPPRFDEAAYTRAHPFDPGYDDPNAWKQAKDIAKANFDAANGCPEGWVTNTPGSLVSSQIMTAMSSNYRQTELGAAMGNSLSAIFDALLNKFLSDGLNSLSSRVNPRPASDDYSYEGISLGSPTTSGTNSTWDSGPDQPIVLKSFKDTVNSDIANTEEELRLMYNTGTGDPGIYQMYGMIWPKAQQLDACVPGPDYKWQDRLKEEQEGYTKRLMEVGSSGGNSEDGEKVVNELNLSVKAFQNWISDKMMTEIPGSLLFIDAVESVKQFPQESAELMDKRKIRNRGLARLNSIKISLDDITKQPDPNSAEERSLISIWKQYQAAKVDFSNTVTIEETRNQLSALNDKYKDLVHYLDPAYPLSCPAQKTKANITLASEKASFCSVPITHGYPHKMFNQYQAGGSNTYPDLPLVNANRVLRYKTLTLSTFLKSIVKSLGTFGRAQSPYGDAYIGIQISCDTIYTSSSVDYSAGIPGISTQPTPPPPYTPPVNPLGNCTYSDGSIDVGIEQGQCLLGQGTWTPSSSLGTCVIQGVTIPDTEQSECTSAGGIWTSENS